ncbi:MAG: hypothetical protein ACW98Y_19050, partial [Candidatus Thorarchaeota archaeon]
MKLIRRNIATVIAILSMSIILGSTLASISIDKVSVSTQTTSHCGEGVSTDEAPQIHSEKQIAPAEEVLGNQELFWVMYPSGAEQELATLLSVGTHCYIYMENSCIESQGESNAIAKCDEFREAFDNEVYPMGTELAGNPDGTLGDIDGDPRVTVYFGPFFEKSGRTLNGFYTLGNDLEGAFSNYREMFYMDASNTLNDAIPLSIHEFNHLIFYNHDLNEADFLTEGLANFAIQYCGYWSTIVDAQVRRYTQNPQDSLLYFNRISSNYYWDVSYGQSHVFMTYLYERFGLDFIRSLVSIPEDGAIAIDVALSNEGYNFTFNDVYLDWIVAVTLDNPEIYDGIYGYTSVNCTIDCHNSVGSVYPIEKSDITFNYYGIHARKLYSPLDSMALKIENPHSGVLGIAIAMLDDEGWHVTQTLHTEHSTEITEYIQGTNIQEVYIIASLMSEDTPSEFGVAYALDEVPNLDLDYSISERVQSEASGIPIFFIPIAGVMTVIL